MTGGCCDGLHSDRVNRNQGAESTLAFLLSLVEMRPRAECSEQLPNADRAGRIITYMTLEVKRSAIVLQPDQTRVLLRPFMPGNPEKIAAHHRPHHGAGGG